MIKITNRGEKPLKVTTYDESLQKIVSIVRIEVGLSEEFKVDKDHTLRVAEAA